MKQIPKIVVQLVHIQGPMMGQIQEFSDSEISIGRHPACQVQFPNEVTILSRHHARIVRDGNRFKIIDESSNGTFLNGKEIEEAYLKDGDVLIFAEGGPKVSFLTKTVAQPQTDDTEVRSAPPPRSSFDAVATVDQELEPEVSAAKDHPQSKTPALHPAKVKMPLIIQFGPTLRSFNELPITIGKHPNCDFVLEHQQILDQHVEIFYDQDQYWLKDLTGLNQVAVNGQPVAPQAPLNANDTLTLSSIGPEFKFLGGGRLAEVERPPQPEPEPEPFSSPPQQDSDSPKTKSIFKKLWDR